MPFTVTIGMIFIGSYLGGRLQDRHGPRIVALGGGVIYAVGIVLASFTNGAGDYWLVIVGYGVISGFGLGFAYIVPIAMLQRSEEHTSELQSLMRISYAVFCLKKKKKQIKSSV